MTTTIGIEADTQWNRVNGKKTFLKHRCREERILIDAGLPVILAELDTEIKSALQGGAIHAGGGSLPGTAQGDFCRPISYDLFREVAGLPRH